MQHLEEIRKYLERNNLKRLPKEIEDRFFRAYEYLVERIEKGKLPYYSEKEYLGDNDLARTIYRNKYYLKHGKRVLEKSPCDVFLRVASFLASVEDEYEKWAEEFYKVLVEGYFVPGGRILAGAGDMTKKKSLANCFVIPIKEDSIEGIFQAALETARTYSYGGGVGIDVTCLRPKFSPVHNAAQFSTGPVSFMEIYSLVTLIIGQEGRRGALMLTIDCKHPDVLEFIRAKSESNWIIDTAIEELKFRGVNDEKILEIVKKVMINNFRIRGANISVKFSDEFFLAVEEENKYGRDKILVYKKKYKGVLKEVYQKKNEFSYGIPSKDISKYELLKVFNNVDELNEWLSSEYGVRVKEEDLKDPYKRDVYGDYVIELEDKDYDLAIRYSGDFLLYWASEEVGVIKRLVKARDIWNEFVIKTWESGEPGIMYWDNMKKYSPSDYIGEPIMTTNPCSELPLEPYGACNLGSLVLPRFVENPFEDNVSIDMEKLKEVIYIVVRMLDNVQELNSYLNPLEGQRKAAKKLRRIGLGVMGLADLLAMLRIDYDSDKALLVSEKLANYIFNEGYRVSALLAEEKGEFALFNYKKYSKNPYFERLNPDVKELIKKNGLRNATIFAIAPTGTISLIARHQVYNNIPFVGVSNGLEPFYQISYIRRSESLEKKFFRVFMSTIKLYLIKNNLLEEFEKIERDEEIERRLPSYLTRVAHKIDYKYRIYIMSIWQKYVDSSISTTINLPEDIEPEVISELYLLGWKYGLKSIAIYREGSRYEILISTKKDSEFRKYKDKIFKVRINDRVVKLRGKDILFIDGKLLTVYHAWKKGLIDADVE